MWICIDGFAETLKVMWEQTRVIAFTTGRFGNSDAKKFPKSPERFLPFHWDKKPGTTNNEDILKQHAIMKARREELKKNASRGKHIS